MSEDSQEEIYAIDKLLCTICQHDLNHSLYLIRSHPILSVPLCILCHEDIMKSEIFEEDADVSDFCTWCGDGGDLMVCSDEENCNRAFCRDCLTTNLGKETMKTIENTDDWKCLCCDTSVLTPFTAALERGSINSVYNQPLPEANSNADEMKEEDADDDNPEAARNMYILQCIVCECDNMTNTLSESALIDKAAQIRDELRQTADPNNRIHEAAEEEMQAWQAHWTRHYDILQTQEAALHDHLSSLGYDPQQLHSYSLSEEALAGQLTVREKVAKAAADLELNSAPVEVKKKKSTAEGDSSQTDKVGSSTTAPLWAAPKRPALKSKKLKIHWEEKVVEVDEDQRLPALTAQALQDPLVLQYQDSEKYPYIDPSRYPSSFCNVTPLSVIKAYYYASASERRVFARSYDILPHICIILSSLSLNLSFPHHTDHWSFADSVHPAVRLALFYAESATTSMILCQHYKLSDDYCQVTDFGSTADIMSTYNSTRKAHNKQSQKSGFGEKHIEKFTLAQIKDAEDKEEYNDIYLLQEYYSNEHIKQLNQNNKKCYKCKQNNCQCLTNSETIRKKIQPIIKNDADDEEKCLKERKKFLKVVMGRRNRLERDEKKLYDPCSEQHRGYTSTIAAATTSTIAATTTTTTTATTTAAAGTTSIGLESEEVVFVKAEPAPGGNSSSIEECGHLHTAAPREACTVEVAQEDQISVGYLVEDSASMEQSTDRRSKAEVSITREMITAAQSEVADTATESASKTQIGQDTTVRTPSSSIAAAYTEEFQSTVSSASAQKPTACMATPTSTSVVNASKVEMVDLTNESDDEDSTTAADLPNNTSNTINTTSSNSKKTPPMTTPTTKYSEPEAPDSELTKQLRTTEPLPLPMFVPKAPPARPSQSIRATGKIDSFFHTHFPGPPAGAHITTVDSDDDDLEEQFEEEDAELGGSGQKRSLADTKKKRGQPSKRSRVALALWSKETLEVNKADRQRREELMRYKYFNEDSGFALNQERPEGDNAVMLIEDFYEKLKAHQKEGVRFLWKNVMGSVKMATNSADSGSGCIIAHCMGLGKTLTVIAFTATLLTNPLVLSIEDPWRPPETKDSKSATETNKTTSSNSCSSSSISSSIVPTSTSTTSSMECSTIPSSNPAAATGVAAPSPTIIPRKRLIHTVLIVAPKNTLDNWIMEFKRWTPPELHGALHVTSIISNPGERATWAGRLQRLKDWHSTGGVMVMSYDMFRLLTNLENSKAVKEDARATEASGTGIGDKVMDPTGVEEGLTKTSRVPPTSNTTSGSTGVSLAHIREARKYLQNPGPDLVVTDEAHVIKEKNSMINQMMAQIRTKRRIALTGSPLQNNLMEYWCMINWVKYRFLGDFKEFRRYYVEPIKAGSDKKAIPSQVRKMKQRTHILNKKLIPIVDRKDMHTLEKDLQPKREFTICIRMTSFQQYLYKYFLTLLNQFSNKTKQLLVGYNCLLRIWNHPACAVLHDFKETTSQLRIAAKNSNTDLAAIGPKTTTPSSSISGIDRWATSTNTTISAAVQGEVGSMTPQQSVLKMRPSKCTLQYVREQLTATVRHFQQDDARLLAEVQQSASQVEESLLRKSTAVSTSSSVGLGRDPVKLDNDTDDSRQDRKHKRHKKARKQVQDDDSETVESADDGSSLEGFVVDDDVIEYEEASESELGKKRLRGSSKSSGTAEKRRLCKNGKPIHSADETASEGEEGEHSDSAGTAETTRRSVELTGEAQLEEQTAESGDDSESADEHVAGKGLPEAGPSAADSRASSPRSTEEVTATTAAALAAAIAEKVNSSEGVDTLLTELAAAQSQDAYTEEQADDIARSLAISSDWWKKIAVTENASDSHNPEHQQMIDSLQLLKLSNKMVTLLSLLALSVLQGDKMLVFSQSLYSLDAIEMFLGMSHWDRLIESIQQYSYERRKFSQWQLNKDYLRIDGASGQRQKCIDKFNKKGAPYHLMLISTKAGNMGINLQAANRVVIFDTSWNPVHDLQAMYRAYRYGQTKPVFVYRLLSAGSMEERIYKMQVIKQSLSARVVDAQMPDNHFSAEETLLSFDVQDDTTENLDRAAQVLEGAVKDEVLGTFVRHFASDLLTSIEDHSGLLEDNKDEHLNEEEQKQAEADLLLEMGRVSAEKMAQQAQLAAIQASIASGTQGQTVLNVPINMQQQVSGVSSSTSTSAEAEHMHDTHSAAFAAQTHSGIPTTLPSLGSAGIATGSAAEHAYIQQQIQQQQQKQQQVREHILYQQQQKQLMYTEKLKAAIEKNQNQSVTGQLRQDHSVERPSIQTAVHNGPAATTPANIQQNKTPQAHPNPGHHNLPSSERTNISTSTTTTAPAIGNPARSAGQAASGQNTSTTVVGAPVPPSGTALTNREDILILFSQTVAPDPTFNSTVRLLNSQLQNTGTIYSTETIAQRHAELVHSGRAQQMMQLPALRYAIQQYKKNGAPAPATSNS